MVCVPFAIVVASLCWTFGLSIENNSNMTPSTFTAFSADTSLDGRRSTSQSGGIDVISASGLYCTSQCNARVNCTSYFENVSLNKCHLHVEMFNTTSHGLTEERGWKYYVRTDCKLSAGFVLDTKLTICVKVMFEILESVDVMQTRCEAEGARLVRIDSTEKGRRVIDIIENQIQSKNITDSERHNVAIGGRKNRSTGDWFFEDGTRLEYFNWRNLTDFRTGKKYVCLRMSVNSDWLWDPANCWMPNKWFICEIDLHRS